jgi:hypothetical protein
MNFYRKFEDNWIYKNFSKGEDGKYYCPTEFDVDERFVPTIRIFIRIMIASFFMALAFIGVFYYLTVFFTWTFFTSWFMETGLRKKMCIGYPDLEPGDIIGMTIFAIISLAIVLLAML